MGCGGEIYLHNRYLTTNMKGAVAHLQRPSAHLWNQCHVELLHFIRLEGVLHNARHLTHDFYYVRLILVFFLQIYFFHLVYGCTSKDLNDQSLIADLSSVLALTAQ